jgi:prevent-host-death family protein
LRPHLKWTRLSLVMNVTNIHEAKTHLSRLIERVESGEEVIIARAGKPVVRMVRYTEAAKPIRKPGAWKGKVKIKAGFYEADKEIEKMFYGEDD